MIGAPAATQYITSHCAALVGEWECVFTAPITLLAIERAATCYS